MLTRDMSKSMTNPQVTPRSGISLLNEGKMQKTSMSRLDLKMGLLLKHRGREGEEWYILLLLIIFSRSVVGINDTGLVRKSPVS